MNIDAIKISEKKLQCLRNMNINQVEDLLTHYPFRYEENIQKPFDAWEKDEKVCFSGIIITSPRISRYGYKKSSTRFKILYDNVELDAIIFNRPWANAFPLNKKLSFFGKYDGNYKVTLSNYNVQPIEEQTGIIPVYNVKEGISQKDMRKYIDKAFTMVKIDSIVPEEYKIRYKLISNMDALYYIHHPRNKNDLKQALRTLKYEEFLRFQVSMHYMKANNTKSTGIKKVFDENKINAFIDQLPYSLTNAQLRTIHEILNDLKQDKIMYRLVQGDVGCGKTLVACMGMYATILSGKQAALLAPTEILAKQHYENLKELFKDTNVKIDVLYSALKNKEKEEVLNKLKNNEIDIIIGTHALFQKDVAYYDLGMVVADEQHRFGVEQRRKLIEKGDKVDFLLMSATPIPRTLAVSIYGDMDVSSIDELPKGRKEVETRYIPENSMRTILEEVLTLIDQGEQCYIVCPAIEKNDEYVLRNVEELYTNMNAVLGKKYNLGLLHGKMSSEEKDQVMDDFLHKKYHILITTTVIEVGIDVADANIMVIYDAHRFGMSQLHQLRGRVGRGNRKGYCYLLSGSKEADAKKRLQIIADTKDGFEIARQDLILRGPGDLLGVRQSGISGFILGDVIKDYAILEVTRKDADEILSKINDYPKIIEYLNKKDYTNYVD